MKFFYVTNDKRRKKSDGAVSGFEKGDKIVFIRCARVKDDVCEEGLRGCICCKLIIRSISKYYWEVIYNRGEQGRVNVEDFYDWNF